jgi:host factor-I protein
MPELDINQPSTRQIQQLIKDKNTLEIKLVTGDVLKGQLAWQDADYLCIVENQQKTILGKTAVVYIKPGAA